MVTSAGGTSRSNSNGQAPFNSVGHDQLGQVGVEKNQMDPSNMDNTLVSNPQAKYDNSLQANSNNSNELDNHMANKKASDKTAKRQRAHIIIHGNLNSKPQQGIEASNANINTSNNPISRTSQDTHHLSDLKPPEHWDPNDDVAPEFLQANGTYVPEPPSEKEHGSGTGGSK